MRRRKNRRALLLTAIIAAVVATGAYAYTNSITGVSPPNLGSGSGGITGYTAGTITYTLNAANPTNLDQVAFTLTGATSSTVVKIQVVNTTGAWYSCNSASAPSITCNTTVGTQATASAANNLTIAASG